MVLAIGASHKGYRFQSYVDVDDSRCDSKRSPLRVHRQPRASPLDSTQRIPYELPILHEPPNDLLRPPQHQQADRNGHCPSSHKRTPSSVNALTAIADHANDRLHYQSAQWPGDPDKREPGLAEAEREEVRASVGWQTADRVSMCFATCWHRYRHSLISVPQQNCRPTILVVSSAICVDSEPPLILG